VLYISNIITYYHCLRFLKHKYTVILYHIIMLHYYITDKSIASVYVNRIY